MKLKDIAENLSKDIEKTGYHLYDLKYNKKENILSVIIDESMDLNEVAELSRKISKFMDKYDDSFENYILDVCSCGIERPIKTLEEAKKYIGEYVSIKTNNTNINGIIKKIKDTAITIEVMNKNIKKNIDVDYKNIKKMHLAAKI